MKSGRAATATISGRSSLATFAAAPPKNSGMSQTSAGTVFTSFPDDLMTSTDQTRTKSAYGLQWNRFRIIRPEEDRVTFRNRTGLAASDLEGKDVLDAGCGMGRYLRIAADSPASLIVGLDLSRAVVAARELTVGLPRVWRGARRPAPTPVQPQSFDQIYSLGVLDHTPRPPWGIPGPGTALEARGTDRHLGVSARACHRGMDHESAAGGLDPPATSICSSASAICRLPSAA